ncbi:MAG TPA: DUF6510 family protein [Rugosimonospora sp.]|jgi:hypothetical protein
MSNEWVDGNEVAGILQEIFTMDITTARGRCAGCGRVAPMAETRVYDRAPGLVARCPSCEAVLFTVIRAPDRAFLAMGGLAFLEVALPETAAPGFTGA